MMNRNNNNSNTNQDNHVNGKAKPLWIDRLYESSVDYFVHWRKHLKEYFWAILIVLTLRSMVGVFYRIPTGSMIPTFRVGDMLVANRFYYGLKLPFTDGLDGYRLPAIREVEVGDVVVFQGPSEHLFYDLLIYFDDDLFSNKEKLELLSTINRDSQFKKAIFPLEKPLVDYDFEDISKFKAVLASEVNYIFSDLDLSVGKGILHLEKNIYEKYSSKINQLFTVVSTSERYAVVPYSMNKYKGFFYHLFSVPIAGFSMVLEVLKNTPIFFLYHELWLYFNHDLDKGSGNNKSLKIFPNKFTDQSKEYVKRLIAKEGDKVEIRNKKVYVNDRLLEWSTDFKMDVYDPNQEYSIGKEVLYHSVKKTEAGKVFTHPLRISEQVIKPFFKFNEELWPYEPEAVAAAGFRDNFGPIIVPKGNYFMMGDNRDESLDSRYFGTVPKSAVKGTPMFVFYPWNRRGLIQ